MSNGTDMALISELVARERLFRARHNLKSEIAITPTRLWQLVGNKDH
ncbi:hypothetical protein [Lactiplantibacillus plantarum]|nr:hypothetical protein [Lactiplantibacillus plantarum]